MLKNIFKNLLIKIRYKKLKNYQSDMDQLLFDLDQQTAYRQSRSVIDEVAKAKKIALLRDLSN